MLCKTFLVRLDYHRGSWSEQLCVLCEHSKAKEYLAHDLFLIYIAHIRVDSFVKLYKGRPEPKQHSQYSPLEKIWNEGG